MSDAAGGLGDLTVGESRPPAPALGYANQSQDRRAKGAGWFSKLTDRTCVLMLGLGLGAAMGYAFASQEREEAGTPSAREAAPRVAQVGVAQTGGAQTGGGQVGRAMAAPSPAHTLFQIHAPALRMPALEPHAEAGLQAQPDRPPLAHKPVPPALPRMPATPACLPTPGPRLVRTLAAGDRVRIGVFGDSFGDGVWAALYWRFPKSRNFEVVRFSQEGTGFTRYQQLNLEERAKAQAAQAPVDIAVINFGANDTQGLFDKGHVWRLLSPNWQAVYADRAQRYVEALRAKGFTVFWMGLPRMRKDSYDYDLDQLGATVSERMARLGVPYISVRDLSVDQNGAYSDYLTVADGKSRLMRASDGVHMTAAGYARLSDPVARQIERTIDGARAMSVASGGVAKAVAGACAAPPPATVQPIAANADALGQDAPQ